MILSALQSASVRLVGRRPSVFFGAAGQFEMELCDLINEVAADIAQYHDWQALIRTYLISGSGSGSSFSLPSDYDRMLIDSDVQNPANWLWGYFGFSDINDFLQSQDRGFQPWPGGWIIYEDKFHLSPPPAASAQARFPYITKKWAKNAVGEPRASFSADTDVFLLPERLLTLGLVWRWRENKKLDFTGDMEAFTKALNEYGAKDGGSRVIRFTRNRRLANTSAPYTGIAR